jgi:hypothetical protein
LFERFFTKLGTKPNFSNFLIQNWNFTDKIHKNIMSLPD